MKRDLAQILHSIMHSGEVLEELMKHDANLKNLTSRQLHCIELIKQLKNPSLSELAAEMKIAKASISVMADRLEKNNFIYKVASDNDRRSAHVHLSPEGEKAAMLHAEMHERMAELLTGELTDSEIEILIVLLNKSVNSMVKTINAFNN